MCSTSRDALCGCSFSTMGLRSTARPGPACACWLRRARPRRSASSTTGTASSSRSTSFRRSTRPCLRCTPASRCRVHPLHRRRPPHRRGRRGCLLARARPRTAPRRRRLSTEPALIGCRSSGSPCRRRAHAVLPWPRSPESLQCIQPCRARAPRPPLRAHPPPTGPGQQRLRPHRTTATCTSSATSQRTPPTFKSATPTARSAWSTLPCSTTCSPSAVVG
mmetsp:Transcript_39904/g.95505  ORF Transcript_39904/g.95505 Transcript_39904/m.95505 type:complete len:220 (-) Transcript_39904:549-1208(-)